jgi:hypothetical protein
MRPMRFRLRTLLILLGALPPILGGLVLSCLWLASLPLRERQFVAMPWVTMVGVASVMAYLAVEWAVTSSEKP